MKELTELRNKVLYLRNTEELSVKGELILLHKLNALEAAINYTHCSLKLEDKETITFEEWIDLYYKPYNATYLINKHGTLKTKKELRKYFDELKQSL